MKSIITFCLFVSFQILSAQSNFVSGVVTDLAGNPLSGVQIFAEAEFTSALGETNKEGMYNIILQNQGYQIYAGMWGYLTKVHNYISGENNVDFTLSQGYADTFVLDMGWAISGNAETGMWTRDIPIETLFENWPSNPGTDSPTDAFGSYAYITGNGGGGAGFDDVDDGETILRTPPMDLSQLITPRVLFDVWFFNDGGQGNENDEITVSLITPNETIQVLEIERSLPVWLPEFINLEDHISDLSNVVIEFHTSDLDGTGHIVEAGVDNFRVLESTSATEELQNIGFIVSPNPFTDHLQISIDLQSQFSYRITDLHGSIIDQNIIDNGRAIIETEKLQAGIYFIQLYDDRFRSNSKKLIKF